MSPSSLRRAALGLAALACGLSALAAFTNPSPPDFRGGALARYASWESFLHAWGTPNQPDDPASNAAATLEQLNSNALITGGNIYIFNGVPEYVLACSAPAAVRRVVLQTSTLGNELDYGATKLEYTDAAGALHELPFTRYLELARYAAFGTAVESRFDWDLASTDAEFTHFAIRFVGADTHVSLDAVALDVEHHSPVETYCTAKLTSQGCVPAMDYTGHPSISASSPFSLRATGMIPGAAGTLFYGLDGPASIPFQGGWVCVAGPLRRTPVRSVSSGAACAAQLEFDFNAWMAAGVDARLAPGAVVHAQFWSRDGQAPYGSSFSDALQFTVAP